MNYELVPITVNDYDFIYNLKKNAYMKYVNEIWGWNEETQKEYFKDFIETYKNSTYLIKINGKIIGFYNDEILENGDYEVGNICIIPEYQGKGIGTKILKDILEINKDKNIHIQYFKRNPVGNLYTRLGFTPNGETDYHYQMIKEVIKMEKFYLEEANINRKEQVIEYVEEHLKYNSDIAGCSGLEEGYKNYEEWLLKMKELSSEVTCPKDMCPGIQYFLIRESDNKLIGMINLRWNLNEWMLRNAGHIGYGVRPTDRRKGYNKISLYLCLLEARKLGLEKVLLTALDINIGSVKTIQSLGGILENKVTTYNDESILTGRYWIDVNESIDKYQEQYKSRIRIKG